MIVMLTYIVGGQGWETIAVIDCATGKQVGNWSLREREVARRGESYYDRHRISKGDCFEVETSPIVWEEKEGADAAVCDAVLGTGKIGLAQNWRDAADRDPWGFWRAMQEKSRGFNYFVRGRPKTARDKEIAAANKARQEATFEVLI